MAAGGSFRASARTPSRRQPSSPPFDRLFVRAAATVERPGATAAGVNLETIRYYERRGLLPRPDRSLGGHRLYPPEAVVRLRVIKTAQRLGFTLAEVADLLEAGTHRHGVRRRPAGLQARLEGKLAEVDQRIADLGVVRDTLLRALDVGCDDLLECADDDRCPMPFAGLAAGPSTALNAR